MKRARFASVAGVFTAAAAVVLISCGGEEAPNEPAENPWASVNEPAAESAQAATVNIGDVEQQVRISAKLSPAASLENVAENVLGDAKGVINYVSIELSPPYPESLPISIELRSFRNFESAPVVVRAVYEIEEKFGDDTESTRNGELFSAVFGKDALGKKVEKSIDLLESANTVPQSILLQVTAEALLMPVGTDEAAVVPVTAETTPDRRSTIKSNPLRVDFVGNEEGS